MSGFSDATVLDDLSDELDEESSSPELNNVINELFNLDISQQNIIFDTLLKEEGVRFNSMDEVLEYIINANNELGIATSDDNTLAIFNKVIKCLYI